MLLGPFLRRTTPRGAARLRGRARSDRALAESLEVRKLLSADVWPSLQNPRAEMEPNETLDAAQDVGTVTRESSAELIGRVGHGTDLSNDVDWFRFRLEAATRVQITSVENASGFDAPLVLTLYGDQFAGVDPLLPLPHRLLGRSESTAEQPAAVIDVRLEAGTYFVAVSGTGNRHFHPFLADSGQPGHATEYGVRISAMSGRAPAGIQDPFAPIPEVSRTGDDTPATARELGELTVLGHIQSSGMIGDDRFYSLSSQNPFARNPAADVDLFHFTIAGDGRFALVAEAFAGRIGSPLDPALTLFRAGDAGSLQLVGTNNNTLNAAESTNGQFPLFADSVLYAGLTSGDYFLAVSSSGNDPESGMEGLFNPHLPHSGTNGDSTGRYVIDLQVYPDSERPQVLSTNPAAGTTLTQSPRSIEVQFSELMNLPQLAYTAFTQAGDATVQAVFVEGPDGERYVPRFQSFDPATGTARFLMLDGLPNGTFALHVSGDLGITDLAGNPLAPNDPSGDFVTRFTVNGPPRGTGSNMTSWLDQSGNDTLATPQVLGPLFPHELQAGVTLTRTATFNGDPPADAEDYFQIELLQTQSYFFTWSESGQAAPPLELLDERGQPVPLASLPGGLGLLGFVPAGTYIVHVGPWDSDTAAHVSYRLEIKLGGAFENPTPLTTGAAPAAAIRLASNGPAVSQAWQPAVVVGPPVSGTTLASANVPIPSSLLRGLEQVPRGGSEQIVTPASDTTLVRLFGFTAHDALFAWLDSSVRPNARTAPFRLSDSDVLDLTLTQVDGSMHEDSPSAAGSSNVTPRRTSPNDRPRTSAATNAIESGSSGATNDEASSPPDQNEDNAQVEPQGAHDESSAEPISLRSTSHDAISAAAVPLAMIAAIARATSHNTPLTAPTHARRRRTATNSSGR